MPVRAILTGESRGESVPSKEEITGNTGLSNAAIFRKVDLKHDFSLKNALSCSRYFFGSLACFVIVGLYFQSLGFLSFFIGLYGVILLERSIYVASGMKTR